MKKSILVLDEDTKLCQLLSNLLTGRGHSATIEQSGQKAIDLANEGKWDLAIVGEQLSDIDGIGWILKLRQSNSKLPLVFISSQWREAELYQRLTKEFGVSIVVHRPLKLSLFGAQIDSLLANGKGLREQTKLIEDESILKGLRQRYIRTLPSKLEALSSAVKGAQDAEADPQFLGEAQRLAHNLKGTASSCGLDKVGEIAQHLERALMEMDTLDEERRSQAWLAINALLERVIAESEILMQNPETAGRGEGESSLQDAAKVHVLFFGEFDEDVRFTGKMGTPLELLRAETTEEAVALAKGKELDAAFLEIKPGLADTTFKLAREIRSMPSYETLPLAFVCEPAKIGARTEAAHAGGSLYLNRPLGKEQFVNAVRYLLSVRQGGRPRILVVDDDEDFGEIVGTALGREGMLIRFVSDPANIIDMLEEFLPDLILLDVMMPTISGFDVCRLIKSISRWRDVPVLFLTAHTGVEARINSFEAGADDYLPKPVVIAELLARVKIRLDRARLMRERMDRDVLTGLLLRRAFMDQITALESEAKRRNFIFSLSLLDVDHFKKINDTYGHLAGDRVLAALGQLLKRRFRVEDLRARWGGEEFILAFRHEGKSTMQGAVARVLTEFGNMIFSGDHEEKFSTTFSAGIVDFPADGKCIEDLIHLADKRLYAAKARGRNQIVIAD